MGRLPAVILIFVLGWAPVSVSAEEYELDADRVENERRRLLAESFDLWTKRQRRMTGIADRVRLAGVPLCGTRLSPALGVFAAANHELPRRRPPMGERSG